MGIITIDKADHLIWLGRYTERVYTTLKEFFAGFDTMIDSSDDFYITLCSDLNIPNIYTSKEDFIKRYPYDESNPDSIISNLNRADGNALVMRDYIGTNTLSYIQLAIFDMKNAESGNTPVADLQLVIDHILAFWGCVDDEIDDRELRNIIKTGKCIERIDIDLSIKKPVYRIIRDLNKLESRIALTRLNYDHAVLDTFHTLLNDSNNGFNYESARQLFSNLLQ